MFSANIVLEFKSKTNARAVLAAIVPDNEPLPEGLKIDCSVEDNKMTIVIHSKRAIDSLRATIEDIMSAVDLAIRASECVES